MACATGTTTYKLESGGITDQIANDTTLNVCTATKILDRLHREFTEEYVTSGSGSGTVITTANLNINPTFYLRKQPKLDNFQGEGTAGGVINRLNSYLRSSESDDQYYHSAVHAVMNGVYTDSINAADYHNELITKRDLTANADNFKGIYGLEKLNEVLEQKIADKVRSMSGSTSGSKLFSDAEHYNARHGIKTTLEEIARRENEIYREKFLHIILMLAGIFLVSTQLVQKYFSLGGGGGGGGGSGFGFGSSNLFTGFGVGSGSGLFSRFGGLGLGRSGRSRITSMFSSNPYSLSNR